MHAPWKKSYYKPRQPIKKQGHHFANKDLYSQSFGFPSSHVWMWEFDHKFWALKNWCLWVVVLEKTLESPWTAWRSKPSILKEINPEYSLEDCCWSSNKLWPFDEKSQLIGKDPDAGINRGQEKMVIENEIVGLLHWLNEHEFEQTLGDSEGQGSLACCSPWGLKKSDTT